MSKNAILIHLGESGWMATFQGPHAEVIADLFDTCTVPTAYTARAPLAMVIAEVKRKNPGCDVRHWCDVPGDDSSPMADLQTMRERFKITVAVIGAEIEALRPRAETGAHWSRICALESVYVEVTGEQVPMGGGD